MKKQEEFFTRDHDEKDGGRYENVPNKGERFMENGVEVYWNLAEEDIRTPGYLEKKLRRFFPESHDAIRKEHEELLRNLLDVRTLENGDVIAKWKVK